MLRKQLRQTFRCRHCVAVASAVAFTAAVADVAVSATILCWSACQRCPLSLSLAAVRAALLHALCVCLPMGNRNARAAAASASPLVAVFVALLHELYVFSGP